MLGERATQRLGVSRVPPHQLTMVKTDAQLSQLGTSAARRVGWPLLGDVVVSPQILVVDSLDMAIADIQYHIDHFS